MKRPLPRTPRMAPKPFSPPRYLTPLLTGTRRWKYRIAAVLWVASAIFFWSWWLQPGHVIGMGRFVASTLCLAWIYFLQAYCLFIFLNGARSSAPRPAIGQWHVAMIVTKTPGEPLSVLKKTLTAMLAQDYPHDTWLADEDPAPETIAWCEENGVRISSRKGVEDYHRATWPRRTRCKEGNLAYFYDRFGYDAYDIVVQLDADHVPQPGYLIEMLRPFADPDVGYVSAPSICDANADESWAARARLDSEATFHGLLQAGYTRLLTPICIGSHYAVRTEALRRIGGLGPDLAEDHSTTLLMAAGGWKGVHAIDAIAYGDGPANVADLATQEFQWSRSLVTILFTYTPRYLKRLPARLKFLFLLGQVWYLTFSAMMVFLYLSPIVALGLDIRFANVSYPAFVGHNSLTILVLIWFAFQIRRDGFFRPYDGKILSREKILFAYLQWPWAAWGCLMAMRDRITGRFVDFRVTPKGTAATKRLPSKVVGVYLVLAIGALMPVLMIDNVDDAQGFYVLSLVNAAIYSSIVLSIVVRHRRDCGFGLRDQWRATTFQLGSVTALMLLLALAMVARGAQSAYALSMGLSPIQLASPEYPLSGAGMDLTTKIRYKFDPQWN